MLQKNKAPEPAAAAESEPPAGTQPTSFTIAMRQVGQEAAQKAKDAKKKVTETFTGVGEAEPEKKDEVKTVPPPILPTLLLSDKYPIVTPTVLQSPTSTAWNLSPNSIHTPAYSADEMEKFQRGSLQSPRSTAWKPTDLDPPVSTHKGSSVSSSSEKKIGNDEMIAEEDGEGSEEACKD